MAKYPTYLETIDNIRADIAAALPGTDPTVFESFLRGLADALGGRSYDLVLLLQQLEKQMFPQSAEREFLERWAGYEVITRNAAIGSSGSITFSGVAGSVIPALTSLLSTPGEAYTIQNAVTLASNVISVSGITRSGSLATATTPSDHQLASGLSVVISGANQSEYNGTYTIIVTSATTFTYTVTGTPATPATGTIVATFVGGYGAVKSDGVGKITNLDASAQLTLTGTIAGVDATAYVQFTKISGGTDKEADARLLIRVLQSRSNPVANFNVAAIEKKALSIAGVTRVKVKRLIPYIGAVTTLFVRDDDDNIIPDAAEVTEVETAIRELTPASSELTDVIIKAPAAVITPFTFSAISPDTGTMRTAIGANLKAFFEDVVDFETDITQDQFKAAIIDTVDVDTGKKLASFTLTTPVADVVVTTDEIGVLGTVLFT